MKEEFKKNEKDRNKELVEMGSYPNWDFRTVRICWIIHAIQHKSYGQVRLVVNKIKEETHSGTCIWHNSKVNKSNATLPCDAQSIAREDPWRFISLLGVI